VTYWEPILFALFVLPFVLSAVGLVLALTYRKNHPIQEQSR
jgi:hypothetical protein